MNGPESAFRLHDGGPAPFADGTRVMIVRRGDGPPPSTPERGFVETFDWDWSENSPESDIVAYKPWGGALVTE